MTNFKAILLSCVLTFGFVGLASAETILLSRGDDTFGQGWLFLDASGKCMVATPRHVLETSDGKLSTPDLLDSFNRIHVTHSPVGANDPDLDLAFISVGGQIAKDGCSRDRIRSTPLQPIIDGIKQAELGIATPTERQSISVALRAVSRDDSGGGVIALAPVDPQVSFQKGMSGGTVTHNGRPIAMLFEVDTEEGIGIAMRYDLIASELQKLNSTPQLPEAAENASAKNLVITRGRITEKDAGLSAFINGQSALEVAPAPDRVVFLLDAEKGTVVKGVQIQGEGLSGNGSLIIETARDNGGFSPGVRCPLTDDLACNMATRRATRLRVTLTGREDVRYKIHRLEIIEAAH
ncbi:hypothetical protein [Mesorhizobium sp. A556]